MIRAKEMIFPNKLADCLLIELFVFLAFKNFSTQSVDLLILIIGSFDICNDFSSCFTAGCSQATWTEFNLRIQVFMSR